MAVAAVAGLMSAASAGIAAGAAFTIFGLSNFAAYATAFAIGAGLSMVSRALMPTPNLGQNLAGRSVTVRQPDVTRKIVYGQARIGGAIVYLVSTGPKNEYLHLVMTVAGHEIESFEEMWFNDDKVWDRDTGFADDYGTYVLFNQYLGNQTTVDPVLDAASAQWTSAHVLNGVAYAMVRLKYDVNQFAQGLPNISFVIKGKKVYNPITDVTEWTQNPALCVYDYLLDSRYGLAESPSNVNLAALTSAVNLCDQLVAESNNQIRYTLDGVVDSANSRKENIESMLSAMGGSLVYSGGQYFIAGSSYVAPTITIDESVMVGSITVSTKKSRRELYNGVKGVFLNAEEDYTVADYPAQISSDYAVADGDPVYLDMGLAFTTNQVRAQRLAKLALLKSRQQTTINVPCNLAALKFKAGDNINISNTRLGWTNKPFQILGYTLNASSDGSIVVDVSAIETSAELYDWQSSDEKDYLSAGELSLYDGKTTVAPASVTATPYTFLAADGTVESGLDVSFPESNDAFVEHYRVEWKTGASEYQSTIVKFGPVRLTNLISDALYNVRVIAVNQLKVDSLPVSTVATTIVDNTAPNVPTGMSATGGFKSIKVKWTNPTALDLSHVNIKSHPTNVEGSATALGSISGESFVDVNLDTNVTRYYWLQSVDFTGNQSAWAAVGSATTVSTALSSADHDIPSFYRISKTGSTAPTVAQFLAEAGRAAKNNDIVITTDTSVSPNLTYGWVYNGSAWVAEANFFSGNMIVSGTIAGDKINSLTTVTAGSGNNVAVLSGADPSYRIWAGHADSASAPFTVRQDGHLTATGADINGNISASTLVLADTNQGYNLTAQAVYAASVGLAALKPDVLNYIDEVAAEYSGNIAGDYQVANGTFDKTTAINTPVATITNFNHGYRDPVILVTVNANFFSPTTYSGTDLDVSFKVYRKLSSGSTWEQIDVDFTFTAVWQYQPQNPAFTKNFYSLTGSYEKVDIGRIDTLNYDYKIEITNSPEFLEQLGTVVLSANEQGIAGTVDADTLGGQLPSYYASTSYVATAISDLVDAAPATLDTLNELAAALGDDPNFATTVTNSIATKLPLAGGTLTGNLLTSHTSPTPIQVTRTTGTNINIKYESQSGTTYIGQGATSGTMRIGTNANLIATGNEVWHYGNLPTTSVANWNTAYGWGNHADVGYLTSIPYPVNGNWWNGGVVIVGGDGVMEVGKYLDFHTSNTGGNVDYDLRVTASPNALAVGGTISATGLDVTGTATMDGLTVEGSSTGTLNVVNFLNTNNGATATANRLGLGISNSSGSNYTYIEAKEIGVDAFAEMNFYTGVSPTKRMTVGTYGDISFYEDTGTTAKLFWDSSAEKLNLTGVGGLDVTGTASMSGLTVESTLATIGLGGTANQATELRLEGTSNAANGAYLRGRRGGSSSFLIGDAAGALGSGTGLINYVYGANPWLVYTNATERMRIDSAGNVGIVSGDISLAAGKFLKYSATSYITPENNVSGAEVSTAGAFSVKTGATPTERMRIDSAGNVAIGTTSPSGYRLNVSSGAVGSIAQITDGVANTFIFRSDANTLYAGNANNFPLAFVVNNTERMRLTATGLGINTTSPESLLHLGENHLSAIAIGNPAWHNTEIIRSEFTNNTDKLVFNVPAGTATGFSADPFVITKSGSVGIGTSSPATLMELASTTPILRITNTTDAAWSAGQDIGRLSFYSTDASAVGPHETAFILNESDFGSGVTQLSGALSFGTAAYNAAATERMRIDSAGNVGIGAGNSKEAMIQSTNSGRVASNPAYSFNGDLDTGMFNPQTDNTIAFATAGTERMRIDSAGNLLVGKSGSAFSSNGVELRPNGALWATVIGQGAASFNIKGTDGVITDFYKDGTSVGSIDSVAGTSLNVSSATGILYLGGTVTGGLRAINAIGSGTPRLDPTDDNTTNLGVSSNRFKDLYLSGNAIVNGSVSAMQWVGYGSSSTAFVQVGAENNTAVDNGATYLHRLSTEGNQTNHSLVFKRLRSLASDAESMRIDGYGNVGIGTSPDKKLDIYGSGAAEGVFVRNSSNSNYRGYYMGATDSDNTVYAGVELQVNLGELRHYVGPSFYGGYQTFHTAGTERMRIDSAGNLLVGKTSSSLSTSGFELFSSGVQWVTASNTRPLLLNRTGSDGDITEFRKDGTKVGSIGSYNDGASAPYFADAGNVGIRLSQASTDDIVPCTSTGADRDNAINLGSSGARWKDLYLSGTANVGAVIATGNVTAFSDRNLKENIEPILNAVEKVQQLNGVTYNRNDLEDTTKRYAGIIAQDLQAVLPEAVEGDSILRVDYNATIGLLIEAIKEQQVQIDELKSKLKEVTK